MKDIGQYTESAFELRGLVQFCMKSRELSRLPAFYGEYFFFLYIRLHIRGFLLTGFRANSSENYIKCQAESAVFKVMEGRLSTEIFKAGIHICILYLTWQSSCRNSKRKSQAHRNLLPVTAERRFRRRTFQKIQNSIVILP